MSGVIITITGPTCSGKSHLEALLSKEPGFARTVSYTTRPIREGEVDGREYHFVSVEGFDRLSLSGVFAESARFGDHYYATSGNQLRDLLDAGKNVIIVCEPIGRDEIIAFAEREGLPVVPVFVTNPTNVLARRFIRRMLVDWHRAADERKLEETYGDRLDQMLSEERGWATSDYPLSLTFAKFDESNERLVVDRIIAAAEAAAAFAGMEVD